MKKLIVTNWKMQLTIKDGLSLAKKITKNIKTFQSEVVICPDYLSLPFISPVLKKSKIILGAQDSAMANFGAYTGEVSPVNLKTLGVKYVIIGHSERREHLHENSAIIKDKVNASLANNLIPVLCIGEKLSEKESGETKNYLKTELRHALRGVRIKTAADLVIAYEPIWAISSNKNSRPMLAAEADSIQLYIKAQVAGILKKTVRVLYGGSVNADNAGEFLRQKNIDGLLIGAASLRVKDFNSICSI
ncbi:MAG: triose-phosphate isomerase [Patescibacteria group bacterium]|jgi:triosephosphate isomerase